MIDKKSASDGLDMMKINEFSNKQTKNGSLRENPIVQYFIIWVCYSWIPPKTTFSSSLFYEWLVVGGTQRYDEKKKLKAGLKAGHYIEYLFLVKVSIVLKAKEQTVMKSFGAQNFFFETFEWEVLGH